MKSGYRTDLAYIHDSAFSWFVRGAAPWLLKTIRETGKRRGLIVDLACGSGTWASHLLHAGYDVVGIDLSPSMIRLAKRHAPNAKLRVGSLLTAKIPPCVAVTCLGEGVSYAFDRRNSTAALAKLVGRVHDALEPGGAFIFDIAEPGVAATAAVRTWFEGNDFAILLETTESTERSTSLRKMTVFRRVGRAYRRSVEEHPLRLFRRDEVQRLLEDAGFEVAVVASYGKVAFRQQHAGFVCKKRLTC